MKLISLLTILSIQVYAMSLEDYKKTILNLSADKMWEIKDLTFKDNRTWYFTDGAIKKIWSPFGACRLEDKRTCKDCTCDYYFKSKHPNNRFKGDYPYTTFSEGYPISPNKLPSSGCMQVDGLKGTCSYDNVYKLCYLSNNPKVVFKAYITHAFNNPKDPCGVREFLNTDFPKEVIQHPMLKDKKRKKDLKEKKE
tara:strand:- start:169158 stop:169742 length:585 start_codon:yes stop_codon:yes gene_type:complete